VNLNPITTQQTNIMKLIWFGIRHAVTVMAFLDLPLEILPEIFGHIVKPEHFATLCLVNNSFRTFAVCKLYERVSIYSWHKDGKTKACVQSLALNSILSHLTQAIKLFDTLSHYPYLALLVYRLGKATLMLSPLSVLILDHF
jgi:hypothetical protein